MVPAVGVMRAELGMGEGISDIKSRLVLDSDNEILS